MAQYRIVAEWTLANGQVGQNILHANVINGEVANQADLVQDIADAIFDILGPWLVQVASTVILELVRVYLLNQADGTVTPVGTQVINEAGGSLLDSLPAQVAVKVNQYVDGRSRPFGIFLPAPAEGANIGGGLLGSVAQVAAMNSALIGTQTKVMSLTGLVYRPTAYSRKDQTTVSLIGAAVEVNDVFDSQRRRKPGVGV